MIVEREEPPHHSRQLCPNQHAGRRLGEDGRDSEEAHKARGNRAREGAACTSMIIETIFRRLDRVVEVELSTLSALPIGSLPIAFQDSCVADDGWQSYTCIDAGKVLCRH